MAEEIKSEVRESWKLLYDCFKHLTTLNTGSIIILATFLDKFFSAPKAGMLISVAFLGFIISMVSAVYMMFKVASWVGNQSYKEMRSGHEMAGIFFCIGGFLLGIISLVIFSLKNFY